MSAIAPFRNRDFRLLWPADLLTSWAFEMENIILAWYILVETKSVYLLTIYGALIYLGTLVSPMFGVFGDRIGHRNLLTGMRACYALLSATLCAFSFAGALDPIVVLCIVAIVGLIRPSDIGVRSALVSAIVTGPEMMASLGIARTTIESARIMGAIAGAGMVAAYGMTPAYVVIASFYVIGALLTLSIHQPKVQAADAAAPRASPWRDLKEGLAYVWQAPHLLAGMWVAFMVNLTAYPISNGLLPYVAKDIYHIGQTGLSYLVAGFAGGGLIGSILLSILGGSARAGRFTILFALLWYVMLLIFAHMPTPELGFVMLMLAGICQPLSLVSLSVYLLRTADVRFRGRVMGVRMLAIYGLPVGLMASGPLISRFGFETTASLYAVIGLVSIALIWIVWHKALWPATAPANAA